MAARIDPVTGQMIEEEDPAAPGEQRFGGMNLAAGAPVTPAPPPTVAPPIARPPVAVDDAPAVPPPVAPPPSAVPAAPPPGPAQTLKVETERTVLSPESKAAMAAGAAASQDQAAAAGQLSEATKAKAEAETAGQRDEGRLSAMQADLEAKEAAYADTQHQLAQARHQEALARADARIQEAQRRVDADFEASQKDYWADKSTGFKIIAALLAGSSMRDSRTLGEDPQNNFVMTSIREVVANDKAKKLAQYTKSREFLAEAKKGPEEAQRALADARADIDAAYNRQLQITAKKAEALKASRKVDPARLQANLDTLRAQADVDLANTKQEIVTRDLARSARLDRKVSTTQAPATGRGKGGEGHPLFDLDGQLVGYTDNLKLSNEASEKRAGALEVRRLSPILADHIRKHGAILNPLTQAAEAGQRQALENDLISGLVRARSGTAASDKERANLKTTLLPDFGKRLLSSREDTAKVVGDFVDREVNRYADYVESSARDPKAARALLRGRAQAPADPYAGVSVADLRRALAAAGKAKDAEGVADLRAALKAKGQ